MKTAITFGLAALKTTFISLMALGVAVAMAVPADRAAAGEPMVLTDAQLDGVTAGRQPAHNDTIDIESWAWGETQSGASHSPPQPGSATIRFSAADPGTILRLKLSNHGSDASPYWESGTILIDISDPVKPGR